MKRGLHQDEVLNPDLVRTVLNHIQEHITALREVDPDVLMHLGEQPLAPPGGTAANQPSPDDMVNQSAMGQTEEMMQPAGEVSDPSLPQPASPPAPFDNLPTNAADVIPE